MNESPQQPDILTKSEYTRKHGSKIPSVTLFGVGILLFFLPFAEIKCNGAAFLDNTGFGIATGSEWRTSSNGIFGNDMFGASNSSTSTTQNKKQDPNVFAIAALALGVIALLLSFTNARAGLTGAAVSGFLAAAALIGLFIDLRRKIKGNLGDAGSTNDFGGKMEITLSLTPWFYVSLLAFLVAAVLSYKRATQR